MKQLFVVKIGRTARGGSFVEYATRYVEVDGSEREVRGLMERSYVGLEVRVSKVEKIEAVAMPLPPRGEEDPKPSERSIEKIGTMKYDLARPEFKELFDAAKAAKEVYEKAETALCVAIRSFVEKQPFVRDLRGWSQPVGMVEIKYPDREAMVHDIWLDFKVIEREIAGLDAPAEGE